MGQTKLTRRQWAGALAAAQAATLPAAASAQQAAPAPAQQPDSAAELLAQAKQGVLRNREALAKFKVDRSLEPATRFEAI